MLSGPVKCKLLLGDCFDLFAVIGDSSVDAIIADIPYGTTKCSWDSQLDLQKLWKEYRRVLKPKGVIILFAQTPFDKVLGCSNLPWLRYEWIWEKTSATGHLNCKKAPMKAHENILVFSPSSHIYNPQKTEGHKPNNYRVKRVDSANKTEVYGKTYKETKGGGETDRYPRSVQVFASDKQKIKLHSTQKPVALLEYLVSTYTNVGDLVLDNCVGSGTTLVACEKLGRLGIGMEKDTILAHKARKRIKSNI